MFLGAVTTVYSSKLRRYFSYFRKYTRLRLSSVMQAKTVHQWYCDRLLGRLYRRWSSSAAAYKLGRLAARRTLWQPVATGRGGKSSKMPGAVWRW